MAGFLLLLVRGFRKRKAVVDMSPDVGCEGPCGGLKDAQHQACNARRYMSIKRLNAVPVL